MIYLCLCLIYRQLEPSPNNAAANSLAEVVQMRNLRKLKINVNVTFIIWIFEWVANLFIYVTFIVNKKLNSTFGMGVNGMLWYYVILPNMHLMNTPHNKDRVIDDGFKNTVKNGLGLPFHLKVTADSSRNGERNREENGNNLTSSKTRKTAKSSFIRKQKLARNDMNEADTLPKANTFPLENLQCNVTNTLNDKPSTSNGLFESIERYQRECAIQKSSSLSDEDDSATCIQKHLRFQTVESIICHMRENVHSEEAYLHYFLQLIQYEENVKDNKVSQDKFEVTIFESAQPLRRTQSKSKRSNQRVIGDPKLISKTLDQSSAQQSVMLRADLLAKKIDRIEKRRVILENFEDYCNDEESYRRYLTKIIDLEENLSNN